MEDPKDSIVHGVAKSQTRLGDFRFHFSYQASLGVLIYWLVQLCGEIPVPLPWLHSPWGSALVSAPPLCGPASGVCSTPRCCAVLSLSVMSNSAAPWTVARRAPVSVGTLQARILEWAAMPSPSGSFQTRDQIQVSHTADGLFSFCATREAHAQARGSKGSNWLGHACSLKWEGQEVATNWSARSWSSRRGFPLLETPPSACRGRGRCVRKESVMVTLPLVRHTTVAPGSQGSLHYLQVPAAEFLSPVPSDCLHAAELLRSIPSAVSSQPTAALFLGLLS